MALEHDTKTILRRTLELKGYNDSSRHKKIAEDLDLLFTEATFESLNTDHNTYTLLIGSDNDCVKAACYLHCKSLFGILQQDISLGKSLKPDYFKHCAYSLAYAFNNPEPPQPPVTFFNRDVSIPDSAETKQAIADLVRLKSKAFHIHENLKKGFRTIVPNMEFDDNKKDDIFGSCFSGIIISTSAKPDDIPEYFKREFKIIELKSEQQGIPASIPQGKAVQQSGGQDIPKEINIFHKEGDLWTIQFNGKTTRINHYVGLSYIAYLLENKDKDFYVHEIIQAVNKEQFQVIQDSVKSRLTHQDDDNEELDIYDQGITIKTGNGEYDKLRKRIRKNIADVLENIKKHDNNLWKHLNNSINTGNTLSYKPKDSFQWDIKH